MEDPKDLSSIETVTSKLQSLFAIMSQKLASSPENAHFAVVAMMKLNSQMREKRGDDRDQRYLESGKDIPDPKKVLEGLNEAFELADMAYDELEDKKTLKDGLKEMNFTLIRHDKISIAGYVAHYVAISKERKLAVIGVKGSSSFEDLVTDCCGEVVTYKLDGPFVKGGLFEKSGPKEIRCHEGIALAAERLADDLQPLLEELVLPSGYSILLTGHSLGAGAASLCAIILKSRIPKLCKDKGKLLKVLAFASPPVVDHDAALACVPFITTIVNNSDLIPRASMSNVITTMELVKAVNKKMEEKGLNPKDWGSTAAFLSMLQDNEEMLMSPEEIKEGMDAVNDKVDLLDPDHVYCPGRVLHLYDLWGKEGYEAINEELDKETPPLDDDAVENATDEIRTAERLYEADGTSNVLRYIEIDSRMVTDHLCVGYRSSIKALLECEAE